MNDVIVLGCFLTLMIFSMPLKNKKEMFLVGGTDFRVSVPEYPFVFFADADEKTEEPTQKKLQDAKKKGNTTKSTDLTSSIILIVILILMAGAGDKGVQKIYEFLGYILGERLNTQLTQSNIIGLYVTTLSFFFQVTALVFIVVMIAGVFANIIQVGFIRSTDPLKPKLSKINPITGFKNMFSKKTLFNLVKTIMKFTFVGVIAYTFVNSHLTDIFSITGLHITAIYPFIKGLIFDLLIRVAAIMLVLGIIDFAYQKYDYKKQLRMTKHEVKEEYKQMEGNPEVRSFRRQKQKEISMNRMMTAMSDATVVVTNPTHYAVALRYKSEEDEVPIVLAKGADFVAAKIRERAKEEKIPIIENKLIARSLYQNVDLGKEIPSELFQAVAEILAVVYQMKNQYKA